MSPPIFNLLLTKKKIGRNSHSTNHQQTNKKNIQKREMSLATKKEKILIHSF